MMRLPVILLLLIGLCMHPAFAQQDLAPALPADGYVYLNMPLNQGKQELKIKSLVNKRNYSLVSRNDPGISAFGAWVPAGDYQIFAMNDHALSGYAIITVKPRTITDLGSLAAFDIGYFELVLLQLRHEESKDFINAAISEFSGRLETTAPLQWTSQSIPYAFPKDVYKVTGVPLIDIVNLQYMANNMPQQRMTLRNTKTIPDFLAAYKSTAAPTSEMPFVDKDGVLYYGADFGQIRIRKTDGLWSAMDTQSLYPVQSVNVDGQSIAAAYNNGMIKLSHDGGSTWLRRELPQHDLEFVHVFRADKRWLITTSKRIPAAKPKDVQFDVRVYTATADDLGDLNEIRKMTLPTRNYLLKNVKVEVLGDDYYLATFPTLQRLSIGSMQWTDIPLPMEILGFNVSKNTGLLTAISPTVMWKTKVLLSANKGTTWEQLEGPPSVVLYTHFENNTTGIAARKKYKYMDSVLEIWQYSAANGEWELISSPPHDCERVLLDANDQPSFCITSSTRIAGSKDNKWATVFYAE